MMMDIPYAILYVILGGIIGFIGGVVGLVLGAIRLPFVLESENTIAATAGTNLTISTLGAITGAIRHYKQNNIDKRIFFVMSITGAIGAFIGSFLTHAIPLIILLTIITLIVLYEGIDLLKKSNKFSQEKNNVATKSINFDKRKDFNNEEHNNDSPTSNPEVKRDNKIIQEIAIGFAVGFLGGMVGLVLGSIRMPAMIAVLKLPTRIAVGTNLASSAVMGTVGVIGHLINNNIDYVIVIFMGPSAMLGAFIGSQFTNKVKESNLKFIISIVLIFVAVSLLWRVLQLLSFF